MPNLRQGTLSFASAKRTISAPKGKSLKKSSNAEKGKDKRTEVQVQVEVHSHSEVEISSDEESAAEEVTVPAKRTRASAKARKSSSDAREARSQPSQAEKQKSFPEVIEGKHLDVQDKAGRYRKYYHEVSSKMGYLAPVHSEGQNKIHQMLRFFDMSYEFGPCIGMTRLERWERAKTFGLNPPEAVREILLTKEGMEKAEYAQCVLHSEV